MGGKQTKRAGQVGLLRFRGPAARRHESATSIVRRAFAAPLARRSHPALSAPERRDAGHNVEPQHVRPFVKRQKNDAADAEAIIVAACQPEMRFVDPKSVEQQPRAAIFRSRERLVHQRTADVNALRALLQEHGHVFPAGIRYLNRMTALVEDDTSDLP